MVPNLWEGPGARAYMGDLQTANDIKILGHLTVNSNYFVETVKKKKKKKKLNFTKCQTNDTLNHKKNSFQFPRRVNGKFHQ